MKKLMLAFAAAATLGLAAFAPGTASAASTSVHVSPAGIELVRHDDRRYDRRHGHRYDRHHRHGRYDRHHSRRHQNVRRVCETKRVRVLEHGRWQVKRVQECRVVRWR